MWTIEAGKESIMEHTTDNETPEHIAEARAQMNMIRQLVAALAATEIIHGDDNARQNAEDDARTAITESAFGVEVREGWHCVGEPATVCEYRLTLSGGGPSCIVRGDLDGDMNPATAELWASAWGLPWERISVSPDDRDALLVYASQFYYGE